MTAIEHLKAHCAKHGWGETDEDIKEVLTDARPIFREITGSHRWYDDEFRVVEIDGMLIGYYGYHITGDNSAKDMDLDYDLKKVTEVVKKQKTVDYYEAV